MDALYWFRIPATRRRSFGLMLAASLLTMGMPAQPAASSPNIDHTPVPAMKTFVIIFRQGRALTDADKQRRSEETAGWARRHNGAGHKLDPRILAPESAVRGADDASAGGPSETWPVTALLFLEASDLGEATRIAEQHPGVRYGASIEVRPWAPPVPAAQPVAVP